MFTKGEGKCLIMWAMPDADPQQSYLYNGKENQEDFDLNYLDYGARWYHPGVGRFLGVDPLAADFASWSPYNYVLGNPIMLIDPDGRAPQFPPSNYSGTYWEDADGTFTRNSNTDLWEWTDCSGACRGPILTNTPLPASGAIQPKGFVDAVAVMVEGLLFEAGKALGLNSEDAALAATTVLIINDIKGLKINKVIKNVDDLIDAAGKFGKGKTKIGENTIKGNVNDVFNTISEGGELLESGAVKLSDGRVINKHVSSSTGQSTISINQEGQRLKKVRFEDQ